MAIGNPTRHAQRAGPDQVLDLPETRTPTLIQAKTLLKTEQVTTSKLPYCKFRHELVRGHRREQLRSSLHHYSHYPLHLLAV